jgi:hypothetical protein
VRADLLAQRLRLPGIIVTDLVVDDEDVRGISAMRAGVYVRAAKYGSTMGWGVAHPTAHPSVASAMARAEIRRRGKRSRFMTVSR